MKRDDSKNNDTEEITTESDVDLDDSVIAEENLQESIKKLRAKLKECEAEKLEHLTNLQRAKADFINLRKRDDAERERFVKFANETLIMEILPTLDSFELAMNDKDAWNDLPENWRKGMESAINQLKNTLSKSGVAKIEALGTAFNPMEHEAVGTVSVQKKEDDHTVIEVLQTGYILGDKVLRPARVRIGEYKQ